MGMTPWLYTLPRTNEVCKIHNEIMRDTGVAAICLSCHKEYDEINARVGKSLLDQVTHIKTHDLSKDESVL